MTSAILKRRMGGDKVEMQTLLEQFNKIDHNQQGSIKLAEAIKLIQRICSINRMNQGILKRIIYTIDNFVTFDEFLALLYETEFDNGMTRYISVNVEIL